MVPRSLRQRGTRVVWGQVVVERVMLINYHEIGLKGRNRGRFERALPDNLASARALATGESLGQVASQTLENIAAVDADALRLVTCEDFACLSYRAPARWPAAWEANP